MRILLFLFLLSSSLTAQSDSARLASAMQAYAKFDYADTDLRWNITTDKTATTDLVGLQKILATVPPADRLDATSRLNRDLLLLVLNDAIYQRQFKAHQFPLDAEGGFLAGVVYRMLNQRVTDKASFERLRTIISDLDPYFALQIDNMRAGLAAGKTDPALVVNNCIAQIERQLATPVGESIFVQPVKDDAARTQVLSKMTEQSVYPAYRRLRDFLRDEYLPSLRSGVGISGITDGKAYYEQRVRYFTTDDISPQAVFETGQAEVKRIRAEMEAIIERVGFQGSFADFLEFLRTDEQFYAKTPYDLLARASYITKRMEGKLPTYFNHLPRLPLTVSPVPDALAPNYTGGRYSPGSFANRKAGAFWVNTYDLHSRPLYVLPALALHEGVPGHHLQIALANEMTGVPDFRRGMYLSAYGEGWALYTEWLGKEAGIYETPYEEFGALVYEMWRACRLVVDPGMHYLGWTREQAVAFLSENTALSLHEVNTEIDRYIGWPGQAVSYKMGELKIRQLRKMAEAEMGDDFDLPAFHDLILSEGAVTMRGLEELVKTWIARSR